MPSGEVTFDREGTSIVIKAPRFPETPGRSYPQIVGETPGGSFMIADLGDGTQNERPLLPFRRLSDTHKSNLQTFIETTISHTGFLFTYTDGLDVVHTDMRYISGLTGARRHQGGDAGIWDIDLTIAKDLDP